jgi:hypothetical protein
VASDIAVHREAAAVAGHAGVRFVAGECSPLELADAIAAVVEADVPPPARLEIPPPEAAAESMLELYRALIGQPVSNAR